MLSQWLLIEYFGFNVMSCKFYQYESYNKAISTNDDKNIQQTNQNNTGKH